MYVYRIKGVFRLDARGREGLRVDGLGLGAWVNEDYGVGEEVSHPLTHMRALLN